MIEAYIRTYLTLVSYHVTTVQQYSQMMGYTFTFTQLNRGVEFKIEGLSNTKIIKLFLSTIIKG